MIDQDLISIAGVYIANSEPLPVNVAIELLESYTALIEQNAELHKELAKKDGENE